MKIEGTVITKYTIMDPKLFEIINILLNNVSNYSERFVI